MDFSGNIGSGATGFVLLGVALRVCLWLIYPLGRRSEGDPIYLLLNVASWLFLLLGLSALFLLIGWLMGLIFWGLLIFVVIFVVTRQSAARRGRLLSILSVSVEKQMPLVPILTAFADENRGRIGVWADRQADLLERGMSFEETCVLCRRGLPELTPVCAAVGVETGAMGSAIREAVHVELSDRSLWQAMAGRLSYLVVVSLVAMSVATFVLIKIVPAYGKIFNDYELELPTLTQFVIDMAARFSAIWQIFFLLLLFAVLIAGVFQAHVWGLLRNVPLLDRLFLRAHGTAALRLLALAVERGRSLLPVLEILAKGYPALLVRKRMSRVVEDVDAGGDWCESLMQHKLIGKADMAVLHAAGRVGNLAWALREVADRNLRRAQLRFAAAAQMLFPLAVIAIGMMVMVFVVGLFLPLVKLINALV